MKILVIGATGMLGYSLFSNLSENSKYDVYGSVRSIKKKEDYFRNLKDKLIFDIDISKTDALKVWMQTEKPDVVINCIGLIKQHDISKQYVDAVSVNALLPHLLARLCNETNAKLIHFSTDCVFSGDRGKYTEADVADAQDLYGLSKRLGEVDYKPHLTLRTSIIGHELASTVSLVNWFLSQNTKVNGFTKAIFSGIPTCVIAKILAENILVRPELSGLYHLSAIPINKFELLKIIASTYQKDIEILESDSLEIDRSLNSDRLKADAALEIPEWIELVSEMRKDYVKRYK